MILQNLPILIPIVFLLASLLIAAVGKWWARVAYPIALTATGLSFLIALLGARMVLVEGRITYHLGGWAPPVGIEYVLDPLSAFFAAVITGVSFLVIVHSGRLVERELAGKAVPYLAVCMLLLTGMTGIVITGDLFNLYVFLEITALSAYALIAVGEKRAPVVAFRYLLIGTIGASFYLLGLGFLYLVSGSLNMADVARILPSAYFEPSVVVAIVLMVIGVGIKMALFPLHSWLPDAYTYAPSSSSALLAPVGTKVAAYIMLRVLFYVLDPDYVRSSLPIADVISWLAVGGILFGSIMAIAQKELKRMLAYSSVAQISYIGLGIGLASTLGWIGAVLHVLNHAFMKGCLFLVAGNLRMNAGHTMIPQFNDTLRKAMPWSMAAFTVAALSMIGIPPTAGFFSKWYLLLAGINEAEWIFVGVILLSSLLNAVYFFRALEKVYLAPQPAGEIRENAVANLKEVGLPMLMPTVVLAGGIIVLGLLNVLIVEHLIKPMIPVGF